MSKTQHFAITTKADRVIHLILKPEESIVDWWVGLINAGGDVSFIHRMNPPRPS